MHEPFERTLHIQVIVGQWASGPEAGAVLPWAAPTLMDRLTLSSRQARGLSSVISSYWIASNMGLRALCQKEGLGSREVLMGWLVLGKARSEGAGNEGTKEARSGSVHSTSVTCVSF